MLVYSFGNTLSFCGLGSTVIIASSHDPINCSHHYQEPYLISVFLLLSEFHLPLSLLLCVDFALCLWKVGPRSQGKSWYHSDLKLRTGYRVPCDIHGHI